MRARATLSIKFYCRQSKKGRNGEAPIELGINVGGDRFFVNLPVRCKPKHLNKHLDYTSAIEGRIRDYELWCLRKGEKVTADGIRAFIRNGWSIPAENIRWWVDEYEKFIGIKNISDQVKSKHHLVVRQFLEVSGIKMDDRLDAITPASVRTYVEYLNANYRNTSASGMLQKLKGALQFAVDRRMLDSNPFNVKIHRSEPQIDTITEAEYEAIKNLDLSYCERLENVRALFIFSCNTGLAYCDTQKLQPSDFKSNEKWQIYIRKGRCKTNITYTVVVLPDALEIAKKYDFQLPRITNQRLNSYLKEIGDLAGIAGRITMHRARHYYARMLLNKYHFSYELTASCLGHASTTQTRHYAKVFASTVFDAFSNI